MSCIEPESLEIFSHYRKNAVEYSELADALLIPRFSQELHAWLSAHIGGSDNAILFEAVSRIGNYGDAADHADMRKAVSKLLSKRGVKLRRGKRTRPELENLVERLTPLLLYMKVPLASSERSILVVALRKVAEEFNVLGDPRDTLRTKIKTERRLEAQSRESILKIIRNAVMEDLDPDLT